MAVKTERERERERKKCTSNPKDDSSSDYKELRLTCSNFWENTPLKPKPKVVALVVVSQKLQTSLYYIGAI